MASSGRIPAPNELQTTGALLEAFLASPGAASLITATHVDWSSGTLIDAPSEVANLLERVGGTEPSAGDPLRLTSVGIRLLARLQLDLESAARSSSLQERFSIHEAIARGSNSVALRATNVRIGRTVVLKVLQPTLNGVAEEAMRRLGSLEGIPHLVAPIDAHVIEAHSASGDVLHLHCVVFPFVSAIKLQDYLRKRAPITPFFFEAFIRQVGGVVARLESLGLSHGDLHGGNILVTSESPSLEFTVIDPSPGIGAPPSHHAANSDFAWFTEHIGTALLVLQKHLPSISIKKHLGPRLFSAIGRVLGEQSMPFSEIANLLDTNSTYQRWLQQRAAFVAEKFQAPRPIGLLRWEEIADPAQAVALFEPYPELFRRVRGFGNAIIVGARGSGKSTYLAALAYFPGAEKRLVEPSEIFGVLFSCRQGEFKQISKDFIRFTPRTKLAIKHVLILKIVRKILTTLAAGSERGELSAAGDMTAIYDFIGRHINNRVSLSRIKANATAELANLAAGVIRWEEIELQELFSEFPEDDARTSRLDERTLLGFCELVRIHFPLLATTRFYVLFDDAGVPNMPEDAQHVLNDLVTSSNAVFCVKLSAERYSYSLADSAGRTLEETHDVTSFDISSAYATEGGQDQSRATIKDYFALIMKRRLEYWHYSSSNIAAYLGDQMMSSEHRGDDLLPVRELVRRLAAGRKDAYYAGWEVVWQLADKTPRTLIELASEIFAHGRVRPAEPTSVLPPKIANVVSARLQDKAIRAVSARRLRALEFIPGEIRLQGQQVPLGKHLYLCATSFGSISHKYLTRGLSDDRERRLDERLAIERNDTALLEADAQRVLQMLVRYGIFDDSALNVAFDDGQKKPIFVFNRIFCPAFAISFRRDAHLRLSVRRFVQYLREPAAFAVEGTAVLRSTRSTGVSGRLWDEGSDDN